MQKMTELFSFAILSYHNYEYITETLDSLFKQTYPAIELLISNDGSSDFNEEELREYIDTHKGKNITRVYINNNVQNMGTVKNVELVRQKAKGEYIMYMAADDALYDETVLQRYVDEFHRLGDDALIVTCQTAMCSHDLNDKIDIAPDAEGIKAIKTFDSEQMFSRLTHTFTIPTTSTAYRMRLYELVGGYDTDYYIIEDAPLYIRMARKKIQFHWIDGFTGARHRDGGISHGNTLNLSEGYRRYRYDEITFFKKEVLPYKQQILPQDRKAMEDKWNWVQQSYYHTFIEPNLTRTQILTAKLRHTPAILKNMIIRLIVKLRALLLNADFTKLVLLFSLGCTGLALMLLFFGIAIQPVGKVFMTGLLKCGAGTLAFWLVMISLQIFSTLWEAIKFVLTGK